MRGIPGSYAQQGDRRAPRDPLRGSLQAHSQCVQRSTQAGTEPAPPFGSFTQAQHAAHVSLLFSRVHPLSADVCGVRARFSDCTLNPSRTQVDEVRLLHCRLT